MVTLGPQVAILPLHQRLCVYWLTFPCKEEPPLFPFLQSLLLFLFRFSLRVSKIPLWIYGLLFIRSVTVNHRLYSV